MKPRRLLIALVTGAAVTCSWADSRLVGRWTSVDANNGALKGNIVLEKKGGATLRAQDQPVLEGRWAVLKPGELTLTMGEYGSSKMAYQFAKTKLLLTYDNGNQQLFEKGKPLK